MMRHSPSGYLLRCVLLFFQSEIATLNRLETALGEKVKSVLPFPIGEREDVMYCVSEPKCFSISSRPQLYLLWFQIKLRKRVNLLQFWWWYFGFSISYATTFTFLDFVCCWRFLGGITCCAGPKHCNTHTPTCLNFFGSELYQIPHCMLCTEFNRMCAVHETNGNRGKWLAPHIWIWMHHLIYALTTQSDIISKMDFMVL